MPANDRLEIIARPEALCLGRFPANANAEVLRVQSLGASLLVDARIMPDGPVIRGHWSDDGQTGTAGPQAGDQVGLRVDAEKLFVFRRKSP